MRALHYGVGETIRRAHSCEMLRWSRFAIRRGRGALRRCAPISCAVLRILPDFVKTTICVRITSRRRAKSVPSLAVWHWRLATGAPARSHTRCLQGRSSASVKANFERLVEALPLRAAAFREGRRVAVFSKPILRQNKPRAMARSYASAVSRRLPGRPHFTETKMSGFLSFDLPVPFGFVSDGPVIIIGG